MIRIVLIVAITMATTTTRSFVRCFTTQKPTTTLGIHPRSRKFFGTTTTARSLLSSSSSETTTTTTANNNNGSYRNYAWSVANRKPPCLSSVMHQLPTTSSWSCWRLYSSYSSQQQQQPMGNDEDSSSAVLFRVGQPVQVEVTSFGPLGASIEVIGMGHAPADIIDDDEPALGFGLISQREVAYFRQKRGGLDIVTGEILKGYVERVRTDSDGRLAVSLRSFGGKAKSAEIGDLVLDRLLQQQHGGRLPIGDKSTPEEIATVFPGVSKGSFKKAVSALYKKGRVKPGPHETTLME